MILPVPMPVMSGRKQPDVFAARGLKVEPTIARREHFARAADGREIPPARRSLVSHMRWGILGCIQEDRSRFGFRRSLRQMPRMSRDPLHRYWLCRCSSGHQVSKHTVQLAEQTRPRTSCSVFLTPRRRPESLGSSWRPPGTMFWAMLEAVRALLGPFWASSGKRRGPL